MFHYHCCSIPYQNWSRHKAQHIYPSDSTVFYGKPSWNRPVNAKTAVRSLHHHWWQQNERVFLILATHLARSLKIDSWPRRFPVVALYRWNVMASMCVLVGSAIHVANQCQPITMSTTFYQSNKSRKPSSATHKNVTDICGLISSVRRSIFTYFIMWDNAFWRLIINTIIIKTIASYYYVLNET